MKKLVSIPITISSDKVSLKHLPLKKVMVKYKDGVYVSSRRYQPNKKGALSEKSLETQQLHPTEVMLHDANGHAIKHDLLDIVKMDKGELATKLKDHLSHVYGKDKVEHDPNFFTYAKGDNPIALLSHIDTVSRAKTNHIKYEKNGKIMKNAAPTYKGKQGESITGGILGADDRAGVFSTLKCLSRCVEKNIPKPSILLTDHEEAMGMGMKAFVMMNKFDPKGTKLLLALDRHGANEYVYYSRDVHPNIKKYIEGFGFEEKRGIFSDCVILSSATMIPHVNLSIGYHDEHSPKETLNIEEMNNVADKVSEMLEKPFNKLYKLKKNEVRQEHFLSFDDEKKAEYIDYLRKSSIERDLYEKREAEMVNKPSKPIPRAESKVKKPKTKLTATERRRMLK